MHKLPQRVLSILNNPDKEYIKRLDRSNINLIDINKLGEIIMEERSREGRGPYVHIRIVNHKRGKNYTQSTSYAFIKRSSLYVGEVSSVMSDGNCRFKKYFIEPDETLDLRNQHDMRRYICYMLSNMFQNNPYESGGYLNNSQIYYIEDPTEVASDITRNSDNLVEAINRISRMPASEMLSVCRYLNLVSTSDTITEPILRAKLQQMAIGNPNEFLYRIKSRDRLVLTLVNTAMMLNIFQMNNNEYIYNGLPLGRNEMEIVSTLQANSEKLRYLQQEIDERDDDMRSMKQIDIERANTRINSKDIHEKLDEEFEKMGDEFNSLDVNPNADQPAMDDETPEQRYERMQQERIKNQLADNAKGDIGREGKPASESTGENLFEFDEEN